jgi:hypothetical protein
MAQIKELVAGNPSCPYDVLVMLADDRDAAVRLAVAKNRTAPAEPVLRVLAHDKEMFVRRWVASRPDVPVWLLEELKADREVHVRCCVARNPASPAGLLELLVRDEAQQVRQAVATNTNIPMALLEALLRDVSPEVVNAALENPSLPAATLAMWQLVHGSRPGGS